MIGIIALLISILLPSLGKARQAANVVKCQSNLRSIGQGLVIYLESKSRGVFPWGFKNNSIAAGHAGDADFSWYTELRPLIASGEDSFTAVDPNEARNTVFADVDTQPGGGVHYSTHPRLMPSSSTAVDPATGLPFRPGKVSRLRRSSESIAVFDGSQIYSEPFNFSGSTQNPGYNIDGGRLFYGPATNPSGTFLLTEVNPAQNNSPIDRGPNIDVSAANPFSGQPGTGNIRWRHRNNSTANALFVDGHVESFRYGNPRTGIGAKCDLPRRYVNVTNLNR